MIIKLFIIYDEEEPGLYCIVGIFSFVCDVFIPQNFATQLTKSILSRRRHYFKSTSQTDLYREHAAQKKRAEKIIILQTFF
jgi:hypothetical protein